MPTITANTITTTRAPLNLFEVRRANVAHNSDANVWSQIYEVQKYIIPESALEAQKTVEAAAIVTGLIFSNPTDDSITVSARVTNSNTDIPEFVFAKNCPIPPGDFVQIGLDRQVLSTNEILEAKCETSNTYTHVHFSFILNQKEEFTVIA